MTRSLSNRYARALVDLAVEAGEVEEVGDQLEGFSRVLDENPTLKSHFQRPAQDREEQLLVLNRLLDALKIGGLGRRFLLLLLRKERFFFLPHICRRYRELADAQLKRIRVNLSVPFPLQEKDLNSIGNVLRERTGKGVVLRQREDPSLLGGWVAQIGSSELLDASIKGELGRIKSKLLRNEGSP